jgi:hypothetical protein
MHKLGEGVPHDDPQRLFYALDDLHRPTPKIEEVMNFEKGSSIKQSLEILRSLETEVA